NRNLILRRGPPPEVGKVIAPDESATKTSRTPSILHLRHNAAKTSPGSVARGRLKSKTCGSGKPRQYAARHALWERRRRMPGIDVSSGSSADRSNQHRQGVHHAYRQCQQWSECPG